MKKLIDWSKHNVFGVLTLFLLIFIPLYPKLPLIDIRNTWVYVRIEDFVVLGSLLLGLIAIARGKVTLKTPLTIPLFVYWTIGAIATIHGILLIFPTIANVFPNVAFLSYVRRIEYMSLFFVAYWAVKDKRFFISAAASIMVTLFLASVYGIGQKFLGFPAFLTMNEEFAKGIPIHLSDLSRVPSTFAGHYDFAAFLALTIPLALSLFFGVRSWRAKFALLIVIALGGFLMITTVSRISFVALLIAASLVVFLYNRRLVLFAIPTILIIGYVFFRSTPLLTRYFSTVREVPVLVDATNGKSIGQIAFVPNTYFRDKVVKQQFLKSSADIKTISSSSALFVIPYDHIPNDSVVLTASRALTGEELPQGTGYINLTMSPVVKKVNQFYFEPDKKNPGEAQEVQIINGDYLVKQTLAYDLSFTTRFQGEWPHTFAAFTKDIFFGSGYGSVSLAVDNSYLRMLGEIGLVGFISFLSLFIVAGIALFQAWPAIDSPLAKSFLIGSIAGTVGIFINAMFIDVFEASKIAFVFWMLMGVVVGTVEQYKPLRIDVAKAFLRVVSSPAAIVGYIILLTAVLYNRLSANYFVGDDFTWLRWASLGQIDWPTIRSYVTDAAGFFYRPGAKIYYLLMYKAFWLNQNVYHMVSIALHGAMAILTFALARKITGNKTVAASAACLFLLFTGIHEAVFWISATGILIASVLVLASLLAYANNKMILAILLAFCAPLFHEIGIAAPLLMVLYAWTIEKKKPNFSLLAITGVYLLMRFAAHSHWSGGDYSYNVLKLPFNFVGNSIGYLLTIIGGPIGQTIAIRLRDVLRTHMAVGAVVIVLGVLAGWVAVKKAKSWGSPDARRIVLFLMLFIIISLLPFLGLGNIAARYAYLAAPGVAILLVLGLQAIYRVFLTSGKEIARGIIVIIVSVFTLFHIMQLTGVADNWQEAGVMVERFVVSMDASYDDTWREGPIELHLVNVPIKNGDAWVLPVGIPDALWLQFHNPNMRIFIEQSLNDAYAHVTYGSPTQKIYVFNDVGQVTEMKKPRSAQ